MCAAVMCAPAFNTMPYGGAMKGVIGKATSGTIGVRVPILTRRHSANKNGVALRIGSGRFRINQA